ncbi:inositol monophosphatase [Oleiharenicola lentus]|uniref:inositol monophosphatase n=1 Tax=Oleiharenicola lentus TaxID=2508720 RepID=UPI003F6719FD
MSEGFGLALVGREEKLPDVTSAEIEQARRLLCRLQDTIRDAVIAARSHGTARLTRVAAVTAADTIYAIDKISEEAVLAWFEKNWPKRWPVQLVMEGLEEHGDVTFPPGTPVKATVWKCIIDPIDGTRCIMYDKRSAWCLAGLAPQRGRKTNLNDIVVAAMTELPTSKGAVADQLSAVRGRGVHAERLDLRTGKRSKFLPRPSQAKDLKHGFASFAKFFPPAKLLMAEVEAKLLVALDAGEAVFDDQYPSTGGQLYELLVGHDRFIADVRPWAFGKLGLPAALTCHPYDICVALIAQELGCVITALDGKPLRVPLDTTSPVAWVGYANTSLARSIAPKLRAVLANV